MEKKQSLFKTKTFWAGLGGVISGVGLCFMGDIPSGVQTIIISVLGITGRDALSKLGR